MLYFGYVEWIWKTSVLDASRGSRAGGANYFERKMAIARRAAAAESNPGLLERVHEDNAPVVGWSLWRWFETFCGGRGEVRQIKNTHRLLLRIWVDEDPSKNPLTSKLFGVDLAGRGVVIVGGEERREFHVWRRGEGEVKDEVFESVAKRLAKRVLGGVLKGNVITFKLIFRWKRRALYIFALKSRLNRIRDGISFSARRLKTPRERTVGKKSL